MPKPFRVVLDTNILLRGPLNNRSAAGAVLNACDRRLPLLSKPVLREYRHILTERSIMERYPDLTVVKVELALRRLRFVGDVVNPVRSKFEFPRDPKDAKLIELAIASGATHIVTGDRDLLSLQTGRGDAAKRFRQRTPATKVMDAGAFLNALEIDSEN